MVAVRYKSVSKTELAFAYNITTRTLGLWLNPIKDKLGKYVGKTYNPKQVQTIVEFLGEPENIELVCAA